MNKWVVEHVWAGTEVHIMDIQDYTAVMVGIDVGKDSEEWQGGITHRRYPQVACHRVEWTPNRDTVRQNLEDWIKNKIENGELKVVTA